MPPSRFDARTPADLARHLDWSEFHEHLLETAFERFGQALSSAGIDGLPTTHNLPPGQEATPLNAARVTRSVDLVGLDYYQVAGPESRAIVARRTTELAVRTESLGLPAFACEMGAGFPPFFPPILERDSAFIALAALAYGLRGFNVYMAVERDRWIGAPIDPHGRPRPFAAFWRKLSAALTRTSFFTLTRRAPVRILTPRSERRLTRVMHAFGPITGAFFSVIGKGARESVSEQDLGLGYPLGIASDSFARTFEAAVEARGVPFACVGGEDRDVSLEGARWIVCATSGGLNPALFRRLEEKAAEGVRITLGPRMSLVFDGAYRPLAEPLDLGRLKRPPASRRTDPSLFADDPAAADDAVSRAIADLDLLHLGLRSRRHLLFATVHEDQTGRAQRGRLRPQPRRRRRGRPRPPGCLSLPAPSTCSIDVPVFEIERGVLEVRMTPSHGPDAVPQSRCRSWCRRPGWVSVQVGVRHSMVVGVQKPFRHWGLAVHAEPSGMSATQALLALQ